MGGGIGKIVSAVAGFAGGPIGTIVGMAFQGFSMLQQRKQQKKAAAATRRQAEQYEKAEESKARYSQIQEQRARIAQQRQARIRQGQILAGAAGGGLGMTGSSAVIGATSSVASQLNTNLGDISMAQGLSQDLSQKNIAASQAATSAGTSMARAGQWQQMGSLAENILGGNFGNPFGEANKQVTSPASNTTYAGGQIAPSFMSSGK